MASPLATKRLQRELKALHKSPLSNPKIIATPHESNILEWHYVLEGPTNDPKCPYSNGIYHGKLIFPKEYPYKPPGVIMCTPNGRFKPNRRLCLSMSDFHPESWNPMWSISTILMGLYSFMMDNKPTTGSIDTSDAMKRKLAAESLEYNVKNEKIFCAMFPEYVELWNTREEERKARLLANGGGGALANSNSKEEEMAVVPTNTMGGIMMDNVLAFGAGFVAILSLFFAILRFCN